MTFYSNFNRPKRIPEKIDREGSKVETAGYMAPNVLISNVLKAGQRLREYRRGIYANTDTVNPADDRDIDIDPTAAKGYDLAQAADDLTVLKNKFDEELEIQKKKALEEEAKKEAQSAESSRVPEGTDNGST